MAINRGPVARLPSAGVPFETVIGYPPLLVNLQ